MAEQPSKSFHLPDEPTESSVSLLRSKFRDDSARGTVSPNAHAHRSRVIRQQSRLLELARSSLVPSAESSELPGQPSSEHHEDRVASPETVAGSGAKKPKSFTVFRSAAEEANVRKGEGSWDNEGGHMSCTSGRIVSVRASGQQTFRVIMSREVGESSEHLFNTMREAEAFVSRNTPRPPARVTIYDHGSDS
jgi:hypothetical protein